MQIIGVLIALLRALGLGASHGASLKTSASYVEGLKSPLQVLWSGFTVFF
jgi:hypothetical protein